MINKKIKISIMIILITNLFLVSCYKEVNGDIFIKKQISTTKYEQEEFNKNITNLNAWIAYWNLNVNDEVKYLGNQISEISYFEAFFNTNGSIYIPEELVEYYNKYSSNNYTNYISIVNDKLNSDGKVILKDTEILREKLKDNTSRNKHIEEIIKLALKNDFDGIEIDYEQIKDDILLWQNYIEFINELNNKTKENNLKLRIVLEPSIPVEQLNFPKGPMYVIMCYNIHTSATEPGEKANVDFINNLINKMEKIPGEKNYAIATGGFDWQIGGKGKAISQIDAEKLAREYNAKRKRDLNSQCVIFNYIDENNNKHEVWYADNVTLNAWMKPINEKGYKISLWKLGGNLFD